MRKSSHGPFLTVMLLAGGAFGASAMAQPDAHTDHAVAAKPATVGAPKPGSEAALRRLITSVAAGKPDYAAMTPKGQAATRAQLDRLHGLLLGLGALQAMSFAGVDAQGADVYAVTFVNGLARLAIALAPDAKVESWGMPEVMTGRGPSEHH